MTRMAFVLFFAIAIVLDACGPIDSEEPMTVTVTRVLDGDTIDISTGERVRYLMVDTPELSSDDCWAIEARNFNRDLVLDKQVTMVVDVERKDIYDRVLAYVSIGDREVNALLVERGYACVLHIPPNGDDRSVEFMRLEAAARAGGRGMWGSCAVVTCD